MNRLKKIWLALPARHRLVLGILLPLVLLVLLFKSCAGGGTAQVTPPPLPQVAPPASQDRTADLPSTEATNDLRLAERRPLLTSPGLQFVTHDQPASTSSKAPASSPPNEAPAQTSQTPAPASTTSKAEPPPAAATSKIGKKGLFAALPADAWLLQVAAAPNAQEAQTRCKNLSLPCVSYAAQRQGRQVWILVVGPYASRDAALAAVVRLPEAMRQQGPFPRQVSEVRKDAGG